MYDLKDHWNNKYISSESSKLGWYEEVPSTSLSLLKNTGLAGSAHIFIAGAGSSTFVDNLIANDFNNITACDLSLVALSQIKERLQHNSEKVRWIEDDLTNSRNLSEIPLVDFWHDRAVAHFFTIEKDRKSYFNLLKAKLNQGGYVLLAAFSVEEPVNKCSNLPVYKYSRQKFMEELGKGFEEIETFHEMYQMPSGDKRNYIFSLFKKK